MLLALPTSQLVPMLLSFAAMFAFAGVAIWLWMRQRDAASKPESRAPVAQPRPDASKPVATPKPVAAVPDVTEFVALPGNREDDSPQVQPRAHEQVPVHEEDPQEEAPDRTEFIAAPLELIQRQQAATPPPQVEEPEDRTAFVAPFGMDAPAPAPEPEPEPPEDRTAFVPPPEPAEERTGFVAVRFEPPIEAPPVAATPPVTAPPVMPPPVAAPRPKTTPPIAAPVPTPAPAPAPPIASGPDAELQTHLELALAAFAQLESGDENQATILHGHVEILASTPPERLLAHLRPLLAGPDPSSPHAAAAWRLLFQHKTWPVRRALPELVAELDPRARHEALRGLASWDDPRAESFAAAGLAHGANRSEWLGLFADRGWDPGDEALTRALASSDRAELIAGLRLAGGRPAAQVRAQVSGHLFASDPELRIEAIETALVLREQSAWLVCRQLARNPAFPRAAELVGLLGSATELAALAQVASVAGSPSLIWGLGLSGRPSALEACAAALDDAELGAAARDALELAAGVRFDASASARAWLARQSATRMLGGAPRTLAGIAQVLGRSDSLALRRAIARELRVRMAGRVALTPELRPRAWRTQLTTLASLGVDLDREFPWSD